MNRKYVVIVMDKQGKFDCVLNQELFDTRELAEKAKEYEEKLDVNHGDYNYSYMIESIWYE